MASPSGSSSNFDNSSRSRQPMQSPLKRPQTSENTPRRTSARRALFETSESVNEWLEELEGEIMDQKIKRWGFDFRNDKPVHTDSSDDKPSTSQQPVYKSVDERKVPEFYRGKKIVETSDRVTRARTKFNEKLLESPTKTQDVEASALIYSRPPILSPSKKLKRKRLPSEIDKTPSKKAGERTAF